MMIDFILNILKWFFLVIASLLLVGIFYEQLWRWRVEKTVFPHRTFVEVNGKPLHYVKKGKGNCTVVFQSGMGSSHAIWQSIQDSLSQNAVTLSYDRNGLMFSEDNGLPVTNEQVSKELEELLQKTHCPKPYILVGHSMAGIYLRPFINQHREEIAGIVFAEAAHPKQIEKASAALNKALTPPPYWIAKLAVNTGIYRVLFSFVPLSSELPMSHPLHQLEKDFFYKSYAKTFQELENDQLNFSDAAQYTSFGNIPLRVITGTSAVRYANIKDLEIKNEYKALVKEVQEDLLNLSNNSQQIEAENSGHLLQINDSELLITVIQEMIPH